MPTIQNSARNQWSGLLMIGMIVSGGCGSESADTSEAQKPQPPIVATAANTPAKKVVEASVDSDAKSVAEATDNPPAENVTQTVALEIPIELPKPQATSALTTGEESSRTQPTNILPHSRILTVPTRAAEMTAAASTFEELQTAYESQQPVDYQAAETKLLQFGVDAIPVLLDRLTGSGSTPRDSIRQELASMMLLQIVPETLLVNPSFPKDLRIRVFQTLPRALDNPSADVRINIATALSLFQDPPPELVPALQGLLKSDAEHHRLMALVALGNLGPHSVTATADIREKLDDDSPDVREAARQALELMAIVPTSRQ